MKTICSAIVALVLVTTGCPATSQTPPPTSQPLSPAGQAGATTQQAPQPVGAKPQLQPPEQIAPERLVWAYMDGVRRAMDIDEARSLGLTIVDLSDDWVPYIFWSQTPGKDDYKPNQYMETYIDLANDRIDVDGRTLGSNDRNYLEVYGIPPTLSVLRRRFHGDPTKTCFDKLDYSLFEQYHGPVLVIDPASSRRLRKRYRQAQVEYRKALRQAHVRSLEALLAKPQFAAVAKRYQRYQWQLRAVRAMQKRLVCEGLFPRRGKMKPGEVTWLVRQSLRRFERKHNVYGRGMINSQTAAALGQTPLEANYESLKRVIAERVVSAAGIVEDGSSSATYTALDGSTQQLRNLVSEFAAAALHHLGLTDPDKAVAFMQQHSEADFQHMWVALQLPALPEYYTQDPMALDVVIDRGDVWYELPFDETGKRRAQPRRKLPTFRIYLTYNGQRFPLVRWRTTVGGWQKEKRGDQEYYKYKVSDVGPRIWRHIVAGPVWVPPPSTPSTDLVKRRRERIVSSSTFGPGYASAYGLVAAYHIRESDGFDNQIRTHGTVNYNSVRAGFSHGCHRLYNYRAVRLFSFVLRHRKFDRRGQSKLAYTHRFEHRGEEFQINLHTRGYYYRLTPPIKVQVLEGTIRGKQKEPIEEYVKKPSQVYQEDLPHHRAQKPSAAPRVKKPKNHNPMAQTQTL